MGVTTTAVRSEQPQRIALVLAYSLMALWAGYLLLAPTTGFAWIESWHNEQRAVQVVLLSLTALVIASLTITGSDKLRTWLQLPWWWWAFVALGCASALLSAFRFGALVEVGFVILLSLLVVLTASLAAVQPHQAAKLARYVALLIVAAHALAVLVRYAASLEIGKGVDLSVFMLGYANPRFASALHAVLMPFVAAVAVDRNERTVLRCAAFVALCLVWTINVGLGTRGIWFAMIAGTVLVLPILGVRATTRMVAAIAVAAIVGVGLFLLITAYPAASGAAPGIALPTQRAPTLTSRDVLWSLAWEATIAHPLLGLGPMQFAALQSYVGAHPHNWPLQLSSEWGLPALALLLMALGSMATQQRRAIRHGAAMNPEALLAVCIALVYGLVDGNLVMPVSQTASALVLGLVVGTCEPAPTGRVRSRDAVATVLIALVSAAAVIAHATVSISDQVRSTAAFRSQFPGEWLAPRFWEQGLLLPETPPAAAR
jgi:O-antigen ligase